MDFEDQEDEQEGGELGSPTQMPSPSDAAAAPPPPPHRKPRYRECLKNHAVGIGGHALDGCGEFMPAGDDGTLESLRCAACNCHRNFHRKETAAPPFSPYQPPLLLTHHHHHNPQGHFGYGRGYLHVAAPQRAAAPAQPLALPSSSGGGGGGSREEMEDYYSNPSGKNKRFRTKFNQEQKEKMLDLAERLDWRIQKQDEETVQQFCNDAGIKRHVLKVWMHNNKHTLGKKT